MRGYDTIHTTSPCAFSVEINGEYESDALKKLNAFDYCTWSTESDAGAPPDLEACAVEW